MERLLKVLKRWEDRDIDIVMSVAARRADLRQESSHGSTPGSVPMYKRPLLFHHPLYASVKRRQLKHVCSLYNPDPVRRPYFAGKALLVFSC